LTWFFANCVATEGLLFGFGNIPLTLIRDGLARLTAVFADQSTPFGAVSVPSSKK
jgi:hypothetical protein